MFRTLTEEFFKPIIFRANCSPGNFQKWEHFEGGLESSGLCGWLVGMFLYEAISGSIEESRCTVEQQLYLKYYYSSVYIYGYIFNKINFLFLLIACIATASFSVLRLKN